MNTSEAVMQKISDIKAMISDLEAMLAETGQDASVKPRTIYLVDPGSVRNAYPKEANAERWITCADICHELNIEHSRASATALGHILGEIGFSRRRSNGRVLHNMPAMRACK